MKYSRLLLLLLCVSWGAHLSRAALKAGVPAPDFTISTVDGEAVSLADFAGKVVVLHFWKSN